MKFSLGENSKKNEENKDSNTRLFRIEDDYNEIDYALQTLKQIQQSGNKDWEAKQLFEIGELYQNKEFFNDAITYFEKANSIFEQISNGEWKAATLNKLARINYQLQKYHDAIAYLREAIEILDSLGLGNSPQANDMKKAYKVIKNIVG